MIQRPHNRKGGMKVSVKDMTQGGPMSVGRQKGQRRPKTPMQDGDGNIVGTTKTTKP